MNNFFKLASCMLLVVLGSCSSNTSPMDTPRISVDVEAINNNLGDADIIHPQGIHRLLKLETSKECLLGEISNIMLRDDRLFIVDNLTQSILVFNTDGVFEYKINKCGRAQNEYAELTDAYITSDNVYILDNAGCKIVIYDLEGVFVRSIDISSVWGNNIFVQGDDIFLVNKWSETSSGYYRLFVLNKNGEVKDKMLPFEQDDCGRYFSSERACAAFHDGAVVCYPSDNMIYALNAKGKCRPYLYVDFGKQTMPEQYATIDLIEGMKQGIAAKYIWGIDRLSSSSRYIFISYRYKSKKYNTIYDCKTGSHYDVELMKIKDLYNLSLDNYYLTQDYIVAYHRADMFRIVYNYVLNDELNLENPLERQVADIANGIRDDENGVLVMYQLKNMNDE